MTKTVITDLSPFSVYEMSAIDNSYTVLYTNHAFCTGCVPSSIVLTENTSGDVVTSTSFCFANRSACLDFIRSSLSIKASLALQENRTLMKNTANTGTKSQLVN